MKICTLIAFLLLALGSAAATEIKLATLNCYLYFDPSYDHPGNVDNEKPLSQQDFVQKTENLASLVSDRDVIALEETGGRPEIEKLTSRLNIIAGKGYEWAFSKGKDTYTGEEVGLIYRLPGWAVVSKGRVADLDRLVSKHLYVLASKGEVHLHLLVVHLIRPIGKQAQKHAAQLEAIRHWAESCIAADPKGTVIVLGDTNNTKNESGSSVLGIGREAGELAGFAPTHITGKTFDRIILIGAGGFMSANIAKPPYGPHPNDRNKSLWTDHFILNATLHVGDR